ncbi:DUF4365 domain-containing protein [Ottowia testudinis]|uniref:DUF4365 domain-containing protein n=1 Tax=Ottowia testudinis TaxID=2816950 RepID=A0A975CHS7_9BURK|nr:DUF4365 domain-containing protein [Ottowia testudinis]QTD45326.1 hypothetical protein J1M35_20325 [Ottowia testudinis]
MPGAVAANAYEGIRSEALAQYALSAFGTAARVPMSDDSGIDFHCTLGRLIGKRLLVENYYLVQVKSSKSKVRYDSADAVKWLLGHKYPILFMVVDKSSSQLSIYKTTELATIPWRNFPNTIEIEFDGQNNFDLKSFEPITNVNVGLPILDFNVTQLADKEWRANVVKTLRSWVELDQGNIDWRTMGFDAYQFPSAYVTNMPVGSKIEMNASFSTLGSSEVSRLPSMTLFGLAHMINVAAAESDLAALMQIKSSADHILRRYRFSDNAPYYYAFCFNTACRHLNINMQMTIDISDVGVFSPFGTIEN